MENNMITVQPVHHDIKTIHRRHADEAFGRLMEVAESDFHEMELKECPADQAEYMLAKVLQHGTYADAANAIRQYFEFMFATCSAATV